MRVSTHHLVMTLALGLSLGACAKSDSKAGGPKVTALDDRPSGTFTAVGSPSSKPIDSRFTTPACLVGQKYGETSLEKRFRIGDRIDTIVANMDYSNISVSSTPGLPSQLTMTKTCKVTRTTTGTSTQVSSECSEAPPIEAKISNENCHIEGKSATREYSEAEGIYRMIDGSSIHAYKLTTMESGEIKCQIDQQPEISKGQGKETIVEIVSNDVLTSETARCGGAEVFTYNLITDESGKPVSSVRVETLSAPKAN
jgi:hypothetical protein